MREGDGDDVDNGGGDSDNDVEVVETTRGSKKRKKQSPVWKFGTKVDGGAVCNLCGVFKASKYGSTSNLVQHILHKHTETAEAKELNAAVGKKRKEDADEKKEAEQKKAKEGSMLKFIKRSCAINKERKKKLDGSVASERVFNIDGLIMTKQRKCIDAQRGEELVIAQDYLKKRVNKESYRLCTKCPQPPNLSASYKVTCALHNK